MTQRPFTLRAYTAADEDAAIELWRRAWQAAYPDIDFNARVPWWRDRWRTEVLPKATVTLAESEGKIIGFVTVDADGYLDQIVVAPEAWGSKISQELVVAAKRFAPKGLTLHVNTDNARAIRFYHKHGFVMAGEDVNPVSGRRVYVMKWMP